MRDGNSGRTAQRIYFLEPGIRLLLVDLGISPAAVLRRAGLPGDLLNRSQAKLPENEYFSLWDAIEVEADDETLPARIGDAISVEYFSPPILAAISSANLEAAARRIATYKKLIGPLALAVSRDRDALRLTFDWQTDSELPQVLVLSELAFWVALARIGTRSRVDPRSVTTPVPGSPRLTEFMGTPVRKGSQHEVRFSTQVAETPFVTSNEQMWDFFEPELRRRLNELESGASMKERVVAVLVELLPGGASSMNDVARSLAVSTRTLQRRLADEGSTFQEVLKETREALAHHYLEQPNLQTSQISFLLGYESQSSFYRAFHSWTGTTPEKARSLVA